jgi:hypothetical protein
MVYACMNCAMTQTENPKHQAPRRVLGALLWVIRRRLGKHSSSDAFHELAIGVDARPSAHDALDRFGGPTGTIGILTQAEDA